jgi:hypothetical protein
VPNTDLRKLFGGLVVIAANAGGAWTPIGGGRVHEGLRVLCERILCPMSADADMDAYSCPSHPPLPDVTTTMLWINGQITALATMRVSLQTRWQCIE